MHHDLEVEPVSLSLLKSEKKNLEVRVKYPTIHDFIEGHVPTITSGDHIIFNRDVHRRVTAIREYSNFSAMLEHEKHTRIFFGRSKIAVLRRLQRMYSANREEQGVIVYELAPI